MSIAFFSGDALTLVLTGKEIKEFKEVLSRGLNTAPPEKFGEWIKLLDTLESVSSTNPINPTNS